MFTAYSGYEIDHADVRGQAMAKRAVILAAAGNHNLLMLGPPGSGEPEDRETPDRDDPAAPELLTAKWYAPGECSPTRA